MLTTLTLTMMMALSFAFFVNPIVRYHVMWCDVVSYVRWELIYAIVQIFIKYTWFVMYKEAKAVVVVAPSLSLKIYVLLHFTSFSFAYCSSSSSSWFKTPAAVSRTLFVAMIIMSCPCNLACLETRPCQELLSCRNCMNGREKKNCLRWIQNGICCRRRCDGRSNTRLLGRWSLGWKDGDCVPVVCCMSNSRWGVFSIHSDIVKFIFLCTLVFFTFHNDLNTFEGMIFLLLQIELRWLLASFSFFLFYNFLFYHNNCTKSFLLMLGWSQVVRTLVVGVKKNESWHFQCPSLLSF